MRVLPWYGVSVKSISQKYVAKGNGLVFLLCASLSRAVSQEMAGRAMKQCIQRTMNYF